MILGIDLGSSFFKAAVFDRDLRLRGQGAAPVVYASGQDDHVEMPVAETEAAFGRAVTEALHGAGITGRRLNAIAVTSQAQTFTVRMTGGRARYPFISWRDARCAGHNPAANELASFAEHCSVDQCLPILTVAKLAMLQQESGGQWIGSGDQVLWLPTWFVMQLTGRAVIDGNLAAMSGLYSLPCGNWWDEALQVCGIDRAHLPALSALGGTAGKTTASAERYGLPAGVPVIPGGNDQTAGAYGAAVEEKDAVLITLGTAQVAYVACEDVPPPAVGVMRGPYPGRRGYRLAADECGAGTINWARTVLPGCRSEEDFNSAAAGAPADCGGVQFIADGPAGSGRWVGQTSRTTDADKARAVLLCLADRMAGMLERLGDIAGKQLLVAGGGSRSALWLAVLAERLGRPLQRISASPALGAARMARSVIVP